jgi:hypothetical protein
LRRLAEGQTGTTLQLGTLRTNQVRALATSLGLREFSHGTAQRLQVPSPRWSRVGSTRAARPLANWWWRPAAMLGNRPSLAAAATLGEVDEPTLALEEAAVVDLLRSSSERGSLVVIGVVDRDQAEHFVIVGNSTPAATSRRHATPRAEPQIEVRRRAAGPPRFLLAGEREEVLRESRREVVQLGVGSLDHGESCGDSPRDSQDPSTTGWERLVMARSAA